MATRQLKVKVTVTVAWWLRPYLTGVALCAALMLREPDMDKVERMALRAFRFRVN